jgi:hypothetical protein
MRLLSYQKNKYGKLYRIGDRVVSNGIAWRVAEIQPGLGFLSHGGYTVYLILLPI